MNYGWYIRNAASKKLLNVALDDTVMVVDTPAKASRFDTRAAAMAVATSVRKRSPNFPEFEIVDYTIQDTVADASPLAEGKPKTSLLGKASALGQRAAKFHGEFTRDVDAAMADYDALDARKRTAMTKHAEFVKLVDADLKSAEAAVDALTNLPLDGSTSE